MAHIAVSVIEQLGDSLSDQGSQTQLEAVYVYVWCGVWVRVCVCVGGMWICVGKILPS